MFRPSFDLSEYQRSESADYYSQWNGCADLSPSFFENSVSYFAEEKKLYIQVSPVYEFEAMFDLYEDLEYPIPENYQKEPTEQEVKSWRSRLQEIREKFRRTFLVNPPEPLYPYDASEQRINAFSGTTIIVPLGEGILNFCYADFNSAFAHCETAYRQFTQATDIPPTIHSAEEGVIHIFKQYEKLFPALSEVFYSSLYTAAFPPQFAQATEKALEYYRQYLSLLQAEFLELLEFCLDKNFCPNVLSQLYPSERYSLWCKIKGIPSCHKRQETFQPDSCDPHGTQMPFGTDLDKIDVDQEIILTPEQKSFCEEHSLPEYELELRYKIPCFISSSYTCNNLRDILYLEFTKILEAGLAFQKCRCCGKYFIVKGNYHGAYCDRIAAGEHRTCQQLAAQETYLEKLKNNDGKNPLSIYQKYYKRYFARVQAGSLKREKFKLWQYEAVQKRDDCMDGTLTLGEFENWLDKSMPNRIKK